MHMLYRGAPLARPIEGLDPVTLAALAPFDLNPQAIKGFRPFFRPVLAKDYSIGLIVGASGSGKSLLLRQFGNLPRITWRPDVAIAGHFVSAADATERLSAVGLNSVPTWTLPYGTLSVGEKFRADLARRIGHRALVDEYTSVVDRNVAAGASKAVRSWATRTRVQRMVFATCHRDVIDWLRPDWVIDTDSGRLTLAGERQDRRWWLEHAMATTPVGRLAYA